jgi:aminoglycoside phosphotransferase (APT) family kinase protein
MTDQATVCKDKSILGGVFFTMDFSPGETLITAPVESLPDILGRTHARLHGVDPTFMVESLHDLGVADNEYRLPRRLNYLQRYANEFPEIREAVDWLIQNRPPEPERLAICHSDFHLMNILQQNGKVTSILDYYGVMVVIFGLIPDLGGTRSALPTSVDDAMIEAYTTDINEFIYRVTGIRSTRI